MCSFLFQLSDFYLFALLCFVSITISIASIFLVKRFIPLELRYKDNPVIGNVGAIISLIYGVLAGLTALYLINNITYTTDAIQREANAVANTYRDSQWLKEPIRTNIKTETKNYLSAVINTEWSLMKQGKDLDKEGDKIIDKMAKQLLTAYRVANNSEVLILRDMLGSIRALYDARQQRIQMSFSELSPSIWIVILIGAFLTIVINYFFGMNFYLHILTVCFATLMSISMVFLLVTLSRPFQGGFVIDASAFQSVLTTIEKE